VSEDQAFWREPLPHPSNMLDEELVAAARRYLLTPDYRGEPMKAAILDEVLKRWARDGYKTALAEIDHLLDLDPKEGSPEYERLELLSVSVEAYEDEHYPIEDVSPGGESK
jgi:hypothetical protein